MDAKQSLSLDLLAARQTAAGGWGYSNGSEWTEPTAYALLALSTRREQYKSAIERGTQLIRRWQREDGGWRPRASVDESTWVTALLLLLPEGLLGMAQRQRAEQWLLRQTPANSTWVYRLRQWMMGQDSEQDSAGWSWFPGTAAWVTPTALSILALERINSRKHSVDVQNRIDQGVQFLLNRACAGGGWNHGSSRALGYDLGAYPETTGVALVATRNVHTSAVANAMATAENQWSNCRSAEGQSWLRLGLMAQGRPDPLNTPFVFPCRTNVDLALTVLANAAHGGNNVLLS